MAHTPGNWFVCDGGRPQDRPGIDTEIDGDGFTIILWGDPYLDSEGINGRTDAEREANARLIAASPDLLEALEDMTKLAIQLGAIDLEVEAALAAIAKAKGGA